MQDIIYDVAISVDGFIAGPKADISRFAHSGPLVDAYLDRLPSYAAVLMGRGTYQFGLDMGLPPGANPYPIARAIVLSDSLQLPGDSAVEHWRGDPRSRLTTLRQTANAPIYLCGGGALAGYLLRHGLVQRLRLKRNPILLGTGTALFGPDKPARILAPVTTLAHPDGTIFQKLRIM